MTNPRKRSDAKRQPRWPRLQRLLKLRRINQDFGWTTSADPEGNVRVVPSHPSALS